jgi:hypothetical protein
MISIRPAVANDAQSIGAVFDAAVRDGWTYLGELARKPMFPPEDWDKLVIEPAAPRPVLASRPDTSRTRQRRAVRATELPSSGRPDRGDPRSGRSHSDLFHFGLRKRSGGTERPALSSDGHSQRRTRAL